MLSRRFPSAFVAFCAALVCVAQAPAPEAGVFQPGDSGAMATFGTTVVVPSGLRGEIYALPPHTMRLPDFNRLETEPLGSIWTNVLNVPPRHWRRGFPGVTKRNEWFAIVYTGRFWVATPGWHEFAIMSDDGSKVYIDDQLFIWNDCQHPPDIRAAGIDLSTGVHRIRVEYFQGPRDCLALVLAVRAPGEKWKVFSTDDFRPPVNLENWHSDIPADLTAPPPPNRTKLKDAVGAQEPHPDKPKRERSGDTSGCMAGSWPVPHACGY